MRAKGRISISTELLKGLLGVPKSIAVDTITIDDTRGIINVIVSSDAPAYVGDGVKNIRPITYAVGEAQEIPTWSVDALHEVNK